MTTGPAASHRRSQDRAAPPPGPGPPVGVPAARAPIPVGGAFNDVEKRRLVDLLHGGEPRRANWARMLLLAEQGYNDREVARAVGVHRVTVWRLRKRVAERGLEAALARPHCKKLDEDRREYLLTLARSEPPNGTIRWTLQLLADALVERGLVESISRVAVWQALRNGFTRRD